MKYFSAFLSSFFTIILFSCGSNKDIQSESHVQPEKAYFTSEGDSTTFYLPLKEGLGENISLDSVYFRGRQLELKKDPSGKNLYKAGFYSGKQDFIMSGDPRKEYGNKPPQVPADIPFSLAGDEAMVVFTENNSKKYFRVTGIKEASPE